MLMHARSATVLAAFHRHYAPSMLLSHSQFLWFLQEGERKRFFPLFGQIWFTKKIRSDIRSLLVSPLFFLLELSFYRAFSLIFSFLLCLSSPFCFYCESLLSLFYFSTDCEPSTKLTFLSFDPFFKCMDLGPFCKASFN